MRHLLLVAALWAGGAQAQDCLDSGLLDCDGDGFTVAEGDCDDANDQAHPDAIERCGNGFDDDCDGLDDVAEGCVPGATDAELQGGSACGQTGGWAALGVWPLWWRRRRS